MVPSVALGPFLEPRRLVSQRLVGSPRTGELDIYRLAPVRQGERVRLEVGAARRLEPQALLLVLRRQELARILLAGVLMVARQPARDRLDLGRLRADPRCVEALLRGDLPRAGRAAQRLRRRAVRSL